MNQAPREDSTEPEVDIFLTGAVFLDIVFTGMLKGPSGGHEVWTDGMGSSPGGVANLAVACKRLGLGTALAAAFGGDVYGDYCWEVLSEQEQIDLSHSRRFDGWHSPVTVSLALDDDRAMVTHAHPAPIPAEELIGEAPRCRVGFLDAGEERSAWVGEAIARGTLIFADVGWDASERWDSIELRERLADCHAFVPNAVEAMAYTGTSSPGAALAALQDWVPLAVVTCGAGGAFAADSTTGETAWAPSVPVEVLDPTGAGDVFLAGLVVGTLRGWPLQQRLRFANLVAALSVRDFGGALAAPGWASVRDWWKDASAKAPHARDYAFLDEIDDLTSAHTQFDRASATIRLRPTT